MAEILKAHVDDALDALEMAPDDVLDGDPRARAKVLLHSAGDAPGGMTGIFGAESGTVRSPVAGFETFHVIDGRARFERSTGESVEVGPGDIAVLPAGEWTFTFESRFLAVFVTGPSSAG